MAQNKRQHYVPRFLLQRFAARHGRWQGRIFRMNTSGGPARPAVPRTEAAKARYYELPDDVAGEFQPETVLATIESHAATALRRLETRRSLELSERVWLAYFVLLQTARTPPDRAERRYLEEVMARELQQVRFSAEQQSVAYLREQDPSLTAAEAEELRREIVADLAQGTIRIESTPAREVASMFLGANESVELLLARCDWTFVEFNDAPALVLPDTGYTRYDPNPRIPGSGSGFLGSTTVETVVPLSPTSALIAKPGAGRLGFAAAPAKYAEDLNLRAHAQCERCIYGRTQHDVVEAHRAARRNRVGRAERRRFPKTLWIAESDTDEAGGNRRWFMGYSVEGVRRELFEVDPRAHELRGRVTPGDLWD